MKKISIFLLFVFLVFCMMIGCGKKNYVNYNETEPETPTQYPVYVIGGKYAPYPLYASILKQVETESEKILQSVDDLLSKRTSDYEVLYNDMVGVLVDFLNSDENLYISKIPLLTYIIGDDGRIKSGDSLQLFVLMENMEAVATVSFTYKDEKLISFNVTTFSKNDWIDYIEYPDTKFIRINNNTNFMLVNENNEVIIKDISSSSGNKIQVVGDFFNAADVNFTISYEDIINPDKLIKLESTEE